jgi:hypothetical protein
VCDGVRVHVPDGAAELIHPLAADLLVHAVMRLSRQHGEQIAPATYSLMSRWNGPMRARARALGLRSTFEAVGAVQLQQKTSRIDRSTVYGLISNIMKARRTVQTVCVIPRSSRATHPHLMISAPQLQLLPLASGVIETPSVLHTPAVSVRTASHRTRVRAPRGGSTRPPSVPACDAA